MMNRVYLVIKFRHWQFGKLLLVFSIGFAIFFVPQQGSSFEIFGFHLWGKKKQEKTLTNDPEAKYYSVTIQAAPDALQKGIGQQGLDIVRDVSLLVRQQDEPVSGSSGLIAKARDDYRYILAGLYARGRYGGTITITINGKEVTSIPFGTLLPRQSSIVITIDCGPLYHFGTIRIHQPELQNIALEENKKKGSRSYLRKNGDTNFVGLSGGVARSGELLQLEALAVDEWKKRGYAKAHQGARRIVADHKTRMIDADITIYPGPLTYLGAVTLRNISKTAWMDPSYILWVAALERGEIYNPEMIAKAEQRLQRLDVFRAIIFQEAKSVSPDGSLPFTLTVQERPLHRLGMGAVYSNLDGAGFEGYWQHRNLFGHAEHLRFDGRVNHIGSKTSGSYDPKNYGFLFGISFIRPAVFTPDTNYTASLKGERKIFDHYTENSLQGKTGLAHMFSESLSGNFDAKLTRAQFYDDYFGTRYFTSLGFLAKLIYDGRDNPNDAHHGFYSEVELEPFYEMKYHNFINRLAWEGRHYFPLGKTDRFILASRLKLVSVMGAPIEQIPPDQLVFAGGGGSIRGYGYRSIGVMERDHTIVGGRSLVELSLEARAMLTKTIGLVGFVDSGMVGDMSYPRFNKDPKTGIGLGLRYMTGVGVLRFDVARPLQRERGDPKIGFYIGIGQAF